MRVTVEVDDMQTGDDLFKIEQRLGRIESDLKCIRSGIDALLSQGVRLMALADDIKAALANLDAETTLVANNITALAAKIKNGMSDQDVTDVKAAFAALSTRLTTLAVDPSNPVPPAPAPLTALRGKL